MYIVQCIHIIYTSIGTFDTYIINTEVSNTLLITIIRITTIGLTHL